MVPEGLVLRQKTLNWLFRLSPTGNRRGPGRGTQNRTRPTPMSPKIAVLNPKIRAQLAEAPGT